MLAVSVTVTSQLCPSDHVNVHHIWSCHFTERFYSSLIFSHHITALITVRYNYLPSRETGLFLVSCFVCLFVLQGGRSFFQWARHLWECEMVRRNFEGSEKKSRDKKDLKYFKFSDKKSTPKIRFVISQDSQLKISPEELYLGL